MVVWVKISFFGADINSSVHIDDKEKDILILGKRPTQGLDDTTLTAEAKYPINFTQLIRRFLLSLDYNESDLSADATNIYQFKVKYPGKKASKVSIAFT